MNPEYPIDRHFNIQTYLHDMRTERRQDHADLTRRVDEGFKAIAQRADKIAEDLAEHEIEDFRAQNELSERLDHILTVHNIMKWVATTTAGGVILGAIDLAINHWPFHR